MINTKRQYSIVSAVIVIFFSAGFLGIVHAQTAGVTLPSVPTSVSANIGSAPGQISLLWGASTESSGTIEGYYIYRNGAQITTTAGTSFTDSSLSSGYYSYTVAAYDANGIASQPSAPATITLITDTVPPTAPTGVTITGTTSTNSYYAQVPLTISWSASTDNVGVVGYYVDRNNTPITSSTSAFTGTSITDSVGPGTYIYSVAAYDAAQNVSPRSLSATTTIIIDGEAPSTPTNVSVQQISANGVNVSWASSTDNIGVAGYQIFRNGTEIASTTGWPYTDNGLTAGAIYAYNVAAYDAAGNISQQSEPPVTITIQQDNGPGMPIITGAKVVGTSSVLLSWAPGSDPLVITGYTVYRDGTSIVSVTSTNYQDTGLAPGVYDYNLTETDVSGAASPLSATSSVLINQPSAVSPSTAPFTPVVAISPVTPTTTANTVPSATASAPGAAITQFLYYGLRGAQVSALQSSLVDKGYLASVYATGFFGNLTLSAVEKFQCDQTIVCTGGAGWGMVGPKTRTALNAPASNSALLAEIQTLEAELASLEKQAQ